MKYLGNLAPCSRVGHIYRKFNPFGAFGIGDYVSRVNTQAKNNLKSKYYIFY